MGCYIAAASDPVLGYAVPRDLRLRQLRGEMGSTAASESSPANDTSGETHDMNDDENNAGNDDENDDENDEGDSNDATEMAGDEPDLDAEGVGNACVDQPGWDTYFSNRMYKCAIAGGQWTGAKAKQGGKCMSQKQDVSLKCGQCMGRLMECSVKCASECCSGRCM